MSEHEIVYDEVESLEKFKILSDQRALLQQLKVDNQRLTEINGKLQDEVCILHKVIDILHEKKYSITEPNNTKYYRVDQPTQPAQTTPFIYPTGPTDPIPMYPNTTC